MMRSRFSQQPKEKRRNSEKRKEKSRDAARCRRGKESEIFQEFSEVLPLPNKISAQLDKASVIRVSLGYIKLQHLLEQVNLTENAMCIPNAEDSIMNSLLVKALEGFILILSGEGDIMYMSENVDRFLGLTQVDLIGQSIYDFSHPCDHDEIREMLTLKSSSSTDSLTRSFFVRIKCTLTDKGRSVNMKSAAYKVIHCTGQMVCDRKKEDSLVSKKLVPSLGNCLISIGEPIPHPSDIEIPLNKQTFLSRHNMDMTFTFVDEIITDLLGYTSEDLMGKSLYQFHHAQDGEAVEKFYKILFSKGQCETGCYRFIAKHGGYVWVLTQATVIYGSKAQKPVCVVCINYILSGLENVNEIVSIQQISKKKELPVDTLPSAAYSCRDNDIEVSSSPLPSTNTIFAPLTKDMSKGFLTFLDDDSGYTVLKDEPEDLTHLAPTAGDVCIPLDVPNFSNDMFDDVLFTDSFCDTGLMTDYSPVVDDVIPTQMVTPLTNDPLLSYRADRLPSLDSDDPPSLCKSNSASMSDLCSSSSSLTSDIGKCHDSPNSCDRLTFLGYKLEAANIFTDKSTDVDIESDEFELRAPYIPMGIGEDLPLLSPPDHLWNQTVDTVPPKLKPPEVARKAPTVNVKSSLAQLLQSSSPLRIDGKKDVRTLDANDDGYTIVENNSTSFRHNDGSVRSDFDGGGKKESMAMEITQSTIIGVNPKYSDMGKECNYRTKTTDANLEKPPLIAQKRNREIFNSNGRKTLSKRAKLDEDADGRGTRRSLLKDSVLMNLLVSGQDLSHGYSCYNPKDTARKNLSKKLNGVIDNSTKLNKCVRLYDSVNLLSPEGSTIPSLLDISQLDTEVNAPIYTSQHLLQGQELLNALDTTLSPDDII